VYQSILLRTGWIISRCFSSSVPGSGLSSGVVAGICVGVVLLVSAVVTAGEIYYRRRKFKQYQVLHTADLARHDIYYAKIL